MPQTTMKPISEDKYFANHGCRASMSVVGDHTGASQSLESSDHNFTNGLAKVIDS